MRKIASFVTTGGILLMGLSVAPPASADQAREARCRGRQPDVHRSRDDRFRGLSDSQGKSAISASRTTCSATSSPSLPSRSSPPVRPFTPGRSGRTAPDRFHYLFTNSTGLCGLHEPPPGIPITRPLAPRADRRAGRTRPPARSVTRKSDFQPHIHPRVEYSATVTAWILMKLQRVS